jgi:DNA-binding winged helix-turn-helix (wHTH) protein/tetratricopeptide (TPR) repeat protein
MLSRHDARCYLFGPYCFRPGEPRLSRNGWTVPITPKALEVLHLLLDRAGEIVTRQEMKDHVWRGVSVSDKNFAVQIVAVRRALGDLAKEPRFVETMPRKGYRFIASVTVESGEARVDAMTDDVSAPGGGPEMAPSTAGLPSHRAHKTVFMRLAKWTLVVSANLALYVAWTHARVGDRFGTPARRFAGESSASASPSERPQNTGPPQGAKGVLTVTPETLSPEAHRLYLKGRYFWNKRTDAGLAKAIEYFNQAIREDPKYARAYAALADSYAVLADGRRPPAESFPRAAAAAEKALELNGNLAEPYVPLAFERACYRLDWRGAQTAFQRGIALDPSYPTAHQWYGIYLADLGRFDEAIQEATRAHSLDPLSPVITTSLARVYFLARKYPQAIRWAREALEIEPGFSAAHEVLADTHWQQRAYSASVEEAIAMERSEGASPSRLRTLRTAYASSDVAGFLRARLAFLEMDAKDDYVPAFAFARNYALLGERGPTLDWVERGFERRDTGLELLRVDPAFDSVRSDPRFRAVLQQEGLAEGGG